MPRKAKTAAKAEPTKAQAYRDTRTGAVRFSTSRLGYPYEVVETKVERAQDPPGDKEEEA
jgi:hypothetical protein